MEHDNEAVDCQAASASGDLLLSQRGGGGPDQHLRPIWPEMFGQVAWFFVNIPVFG